MTVTSEDVRDAAGELRDALAVYDRFVDGWPYESGLVPAEVEADATAHAEEGERLDSPTATGRALADAVEAAFHRARDVEAAYVERARDRGRSDWTTVAAETAPVREAALGARTAGYRSDPSTGDSGYVLPPALCPASRLSMNAGSSPVTYEDRVAQYRAVADRFGLSPGVVYHPGSGHDVSLSRAFPDARVVYADVDPAAATDLQRAGYEAVVADAADYAPSGGADVIVFRNAGLLEEAVVEAALRPGGWVVANDHLESAQHVSRLEGLALVGVVPDQWQGAVPPVHDVDESAIPRWSSEEAAGERGRPDDTDGDQSSTSLAASPSERWSPLDLYVFRRVE